MGQRREFSVSRINGLALLPLLILHQSGLVYLAKGSKESWM